jgi:phosphoribosylglycinamide formyltransferase-1
VLVPSSYESQKLYDQALLKKLRHRQPDLIVLAGYLLKIPAAVINAYPKRIINIHPSLLPKFGGEGFYGEKVHQAVLEAGEPQSGCSVHIVDEVYDRGPVLDRRIIPVQDDDTPETLAKRVLEQEHRLLPEAIKNYLSNL